MLGEDGEDGVEASGSNSVMGQIGSSYGLYLC